MTWVPRREPSGFTRGGGFCGPFMTQENRAVGSWQNPAWNQALPPCGVPAECSNSLWRAAGHGSRRAAELLPAAVSTSFRSSLSCPLPVLAPE